MLALVVLGLRLDRDDPGSAVQRPPAASTTAAPSSPSPIPRPSAARPAPTTQPRPRPARTPAQLAIGLAADGSRLPVPVSGSGRFTQARVDDRPAAGAGRVLRFDLQVEREVPVDADEAARLVAAVLDDGRSWRGTGGARFQLVAHGEQADLRAVIATPKTTDRLCAPLLTRGQVSCQTGERVVLNARRWVDGAASFGEDRTNYRRYLVNHEFGHALGHQHVGCPGRGKPAPVMLQQTKGLGGCTANPWPRRTRG